MVRKWADIQSADRIIVQMGEEARTRQSLVVRYHLGEV